jgi:hypothetical protein
MAKRKSWEELSKFEKVTGVIGLIAIIAAIGWCASTAMKDDGAKTSSETKALSLSQEGFLQAIEAKIADGDLLKRGTITVEEYSGESIRLRYTFKSPKPRMTRNEAEVITVGLVTFAVKVLMEHGYNPREGWMFISAYCYQPAEKSVTGADRLLTYGSAKYDFNVDKVIFEPLEK